MRRLSTVSVLSILLLAGCATSRPASMEVCDCQRTVRVPDKAFREFLMEKGLAEKVRGKLMRPTMMGCHTDTLECYNRGIRSLQGIEMFPQLKRLTCSDNPIDELNLCPLPNIESLYALNVPLHRLTLDSCHEMREMQLSHTKLDALDLQPMPKLSSLLCIFSPLKAIDLTPCPLLEWLYIRGTQIEEVDIRPCTVFYQLHALDSPLRQVVVRQEQYNSNYIKISVEDSVRIVVKDTPAQ